MMGDVVQGVLQLVVEGVFVCFIGILDGGIGLDDGDLGQSCLESGSDDAITSRLPSDECFSCPCGHDNADSSRVLHVVAQIDDGLAVTDQLSAARPSHFANPEDVHPISLYFSE